MFSKATPRSLRRGTCIALTAGEPMYPKLDDDPEIVTGELRSKLAGLLEETITRYPDRREMPKTAGGCPRHMAGLLPAPSRQEKKISGLDIEAKPPISSWSSRMAALGSVSVRIPGTASAAFLRRWGLRRNQLWVMSIRPGFKPTPSHVETELIRREFSRGLARSGHNVGEDGFPQILREPGGSLLVIGGEHGRKAVTQQSGNAAIPPLPRRSRSANNDGVYSQIFVRDKRRVRYPKALEQSFARVSAVHHRDHSGNSHLSR